MLKCTIRKWGVDSNMTPMEIHNKIDKNNRAVVLNKLLCICSLTNTMTIMGAKQNNPITKRAIYDGI